MAAHDDPRIEVNSGDIGGVWAEQYTAKPPRWPIAVLHGVANHFQNRVTAGNSWAWMAREIRTSVSRTLSAYVGDTKVMTFKLAGRVLITLQQGDDQITFLSYEHDDDEWWGASIQSIEAPLSVVLAMIDDVGSGEFILEPDNDVEIGGV